MEPSMQRTQLTQLSMHRWLPLPFVLVAALTGCDSGPPQKAPPPPTPFKKLEPTTAPVRVVFLPEARERDIKSARFEVQQFVERFLNICAAGDYAGYRKLVSRTTTPQSEKRFSTVFYAVKQISVQAIDEIDNARFPESTFRVVMKVEFLPGKQAELRRNRDEVAILVFPEEGEWRMRAAPNELQPRGTSSQPTSDESPTDTQPAPEYPWEEDGG